MSGSKTVESKAFEGARTQSARKHSIFRSMLTTHRQAAASTGDGAGTGREEAATTARSDDEAVRGAG